MGVVLEFPMTQTTPDGSGLTFGCSNCGAKLAFDPALQGMRCPYCGHAEAVAGTPGPQSAEALREIPIEEGLARAQRGLGAPVLTLSCRDCGATVNVAQGQQTAKCSFCGSHQVLQQPADPNLVRPESLVAFQVDRARGLELFRSWVRGLWFRPSSLKQMASVEQIDGVYVPFWTFDALVTSMWTAERGINYRQMETYTTEENGQTVRKEREVTLTRWEPASGSRRDPYDDLIVCASRGLPESLVDQFSTFDTHKLTAYQPEFLAGWRAESYAIDLMGGWAKAQHNMARKQESRCASDVGGDTHRSLAVQNHFAQVTFKHVLLPIWIAAYRYQNKPYRFLVNGQTGEVVGEAPWSIGKIALLAVVVILVLAGIWAAAEVFKSDPSPRNSGSDRAVPSAAPVVRPPVAPTRKRP